MTSTFHSDFRRFRDSEFQPDPLADHCGLGPGHAVKLAHGNQEELKLAERHTQLSNDFEVPEIRHWDAAGHQTAMLATTERLSREAAAAGMFGRWSQENLTRIG